MGPNGPLYIIILKQQLGSDREGVYRVYRVCACMFVYVCMARGVK